MALSYVRESIALCPVAYTPAAAFLQGGQTPRISAGMGSPGCCTLTEPSSHYQIRFLPALRHTVGVLRCCKSIPIFFAGKDRAA